MVADRLDYTLDYTLEYKPDKQREGPEPADRTNFAFSTKESSVGVSVYWKEKGESPDIVECRKHDNPSATTTGSEHGKALKTSSGKSVFAFISTVVFKDIL
nr:hypothetical transcript [Hymenolepis microstoma]